MPQDIDYLVIEDVMSLARLVRAILGEAGYSSKIISDYELARAELEAPEFSYKGAIVDRWIDQDDMLPHLTSAANRYPANWVLASGDRIDPSFLKTTKHKVHFLQKPYAPASLKKLLASPASNVPAPVSAEARLREEFRADACAILKALAHEQHPDRIRSALHKLRGSLTMFGYTDEAKTITEIYALYKSEPPKTVPEVIPMENLEPILKSLQEA